MARINVETSLFIMPSFQNLLIKIGNRHQAQGMIVDLWILAQRYWVPEKNLIPLKEFYAAGLSDALFEVGLAERRGDFVYARGSRDAFQWLLERRDAGSKGGQAKASKARQNAAELSKPEQTQASSSISSSSSISNSNSSKREKASARTLPHLAELWNANCGEKLAKVIKCGKSRTRNSEARWLENPTDEYWIGIIEKIKSSAFCTGEKGWKADFDWFLKEETATRVLEDKYENRTGKSKSPAGAFTRKDNADDELAQIYREVQ